MERHGDVPFWLCVGDVATADGRYDALPSPLHWIKGNNENFDTIAAGELPRNLHYIPNGQLTSIAGLAVAGLGGTLAPTMYEWAAADLPHPAVRSAGKDTSARGSSARGGGAPRAMRHDRRRHFVRQEVDACKSMRGVDVFLSHEAPRPFRVHRGMDAGKTPINEILGAMKPRLHLFGHHHAFVDGTAQEVRSICLDLVSTSYLLIDRQTLECQHLPS